MECIFLLYCNSDDNLARDFYLRSNMDNNGWVSIRLIANFPMVTRVTVKLKYIYFDLIIYLFDFTNFCSVKFNKLISPFSGS